MSQTTGTWAFQLQQSCQIEELLADPRSRGVLIAASKIPDAKLTYIITTPSTYEIEGRRTRLAVKIPTTDGAGAAVEREGRLLVALRRMTLGDLADTIPRYVTTLRVDQRPVLVATAMPGTPMSIGYHQWMHTARPNAVRTDFTLAAGWLAQFQARTAGSSRTDVWWPDVVEGVRGRWDGHDRLGAALDLLAPAASRLARRPVPSTAVHGDLWCGNLLVDGRRIAGVVDWEDGAAVGNPLRDVARFALSYCLYLDRHTRHGHVVAGHPGLRRTGLAPGLRYGLLGRGWLPDLTRSFLADGLERLGLPRGMWYDAALAGIGEVAAFANDDDFAALHLELLASLPAHPQRHKTQLSPSQGPAQR